MRLNLVACGTRMPDWVERGYREYAKRLGNDCPLQLTEVPLGHRRKQEPPDAAVADEGRRMLAAVPDNHAVVALDVDGRAWRTRDLADQIEAWRMDGRDRSLLIGGPDGLSPDCRARADQSWSLSPLTLPHGLVRVVVAEALYRAISLLAGHPYHR
ncbi:MAG: 23S rRNA (pseudouridine(1915)-N(3))-methyltransferase RlmH [Salinisphaeraceae bacterium]